MNHESTPESTENRITMLEQNLYDMHARMSKAEARCQDLSDRLAVSYQVRLSAVQWTNRNTNRP